MNVRQVPHIDNNLGSLELPDNAARVGNRQASPFSICREELTWLNVPSKSTCDESGRRRGGREATEYEKQRNRQSDTMSGARDDREGDTHTYLRTTFPSSSISGKSWVHPVFSTHADGLPMRQLQPPFFLHVGQWMCIWLVLMLDTRNCGTPVGPRQDQAIQSTSSWDAASSFAAPSSQKQGSGPP